MCMPPMFKHHMHLPMYHHCCFGAAGFLSIEDEVKLLEEYKQRLQSEIESIDRRIRELKKQK